VKANTYLFWLLGAFFLFSAAAYTMWHLLDKGTVEWVGSVALTLTAVLAIFLAFYLGRLHAAQGAELPEDRTDALIDDGDTEIGNFSPWSWWPILLGSGAALVALGLAVGFWIVFIGAAFTIVCVVGWTYEYYRGFFSR
jgi:hypothetical protein